MILRFFLLPRGANALHSVSVTSGKLISSCFFKPSFLILMCTNSGLTYLTSNNPIGPQGSQGSQHIEPVKQINNFNSEKSLNDESDKQINNFKPKKKLFKII